MAVAEVLAEEGVSLGGAVNVHVRGVEIVEEEDDVLVARRAVRPSGFLLQRVLQHTLEHLGRHVIVHGHGPGDKFLRQGAERLFDQRRFATSRCADQQDRLAGPH